MVLHHCILKYGGGGGSGGNGEDNVKRERSRREGTQRKPGAVYQMGPRAAVAGRVPGSSAYLNMSFHRFVHLSILSHFEAEIFD